MTRVKRGTIANKRRKKVLKQTKGFLWSRKTKYRAAKEALQHALQHQFNDRRKKKGIFRRLWQVRISAATKQLGMSYSKFIAQLKKHNVEVDRKILSDIAMNHPTVFKNIFDTVSK